MDSITWDEYWYVGVLLWLGSYAVAHVYCWIADAIERGRKDRD